jgi:hypothetical protein
LNDANNYYDDRNNKKQVNKAPHGVRRYQSKQPEDYQNDGNGFKHLAPSFVLMKKLACRFRRTALNLVGQYRPDRRTDLFNHKSNYALAAPVDSRLHGIVQLR